MPKQKLTKGELKKQRDALKQYQRYLPTLQLKKQQLQIEILRQVFILDDRRREESEKRQLAESWSGVLYADPGIDVSKLLKLKGVLAGSKNIAGVDLPVFERAEVELYEYDLFIAPVWVDSAVEALMAIVSLREEIKIIQRGIEISKQELRVATQRVNLFEKIKIPQSQEAIRLIKI